MILDGNSVSATNAPASGVRKRAFRKHEPVLDGIRGLAIIAVLLTHGVWAFRDTGLTKWIIRPLTFGWCGVDLFFVLSGFLITGILIETKQASNRASSFYMRRFLRIFPIYYLTLISVLVLSSYSGWLKSLLPFNSWTDRLGYFVYLQNWLPAIHGGINPTNILGHFWSLAVEEQFYLVWPWLVWAVPEKQFWKMCALGMICTFTLRVILVAMNGPHFWIDVLTPTRGEGLLVGSALASLAAHGRKLSPRLLTWMGSVGLVLLVFIAAVDRAEFWNTDAGPYMYTIGVSALALFFGALVGSSQYEIPVITQFLNAGWIRSFGKYSYGIYVYHVPVLFVLNYIAMTRLGLELPLRTRYAVVHFAAMIALSYGTAWVSFKLIEGPLLRMKRHFVPVLALTYSEPALQAAPSKVS